jgi:hypothetical protein
MALADTVNEICDVRIELVDSDPLSWRHVEVPTSISLAVLHDVIQIVMEWFDYHLWEFTIDGRRFSKPMTDDWSGVPSVSAARTRLRDVLKSRRTVINYIYDFGDAWEHRLTVTKVRQGEPGVSYPRLVGGEWAAPPEDCGGIPGFYALLDALADRDHPDHAELAEHFEGYDPAHIDEVRIGFALSRIANRRNAAKVRAAKKHAATLTERTGS